MEVYGMITALLGGLALFLFGMSTMGSALEQLTGGRLVHAVGKITKNRFTGFLAGTAITSVVQSSSATTVITVGLVNAGIIKLTEAVGLVIGANLGTTATAWILSLNAVPGGTLILELCKPTSFSPLIAIFGMSILMFAKALKKRNLGTIMIGFAVMMTGMNMMGAAMQPLRDTPSFQKLLVHFSNPVIGFLFAMVFTLIIQSSDATIGILQAIALTVPVTGAMSIPLICGAQVGTCITAILSSIETSNNGKRTALIHLYYNLFKTFTFMAGFYILNSFIHFSLMEKPVSGMTIPAIHSIINLIAVVIYLPLGKMFIRLSELTVPYTEEELQDRENTLTILDTRFLKTPSFALEQVRNALISMAEATSEAYGQLVNLNRAFVGDEKELIDKAFRRIGILCKRIAGYEGQILNYLMLIGKNRIEGDKSETIQNTQGICSVFARIGRLTEEIVHTEEELQSSGGSFSEEARSDLLVLMQAVGEVLDITVEDYEAGNSALNESIRLFREVVSSLHEKVNTRHIERIHKGAGRIRLGTRFMDICYSLEKIIDACDEAADILALLGGDPDGDTENAALQDSRREYISRLYKDKYEMLLKS